MIRSFSIRNFGCRVNQAEAFWWADRLREGGLRYEDDPARGDLVLVNTCTLTAGADRDVRKFVRKTVRGHPGARIVLAGCYAERSGGEFRDLSQVLLVVPNREKDAVPEKILSLVKRENGRSAEGAPGKAPVSGPQAWRSRALVKIQDGCDNRCTFCVIPSVRGGSRSVDRGDVLARVRALVGQGFREIVLAGIHLSSYGGDMKPRGSLLSLLRMIEDVPGLGRVRLSSLDPRRTDGDLIAHIAGNPKICQHFHLSLQHASGRVLERMGRPVREGLYDEILGGLRDRSPAAALGADIIVGFPGESDQDFEDMRAFIERSPLTSLHVFSYSPREGTPAAGLARAPTGVKKERAASLRRLSADKNLLFRRTLEGTELAAVVIRRGKKGAGKKENDSELLTENYIKVAAAESPAPVRELVRVRITRALPRITEGTVVDPGGRR